MRRLFLIILCSLPGFIYATSQPPEPVYTDYITVSCQGLTRCQIEDRLCTFLADSLHAQISERRDFFILAYIDGKMRNCVGAVYTIKVYLIDGEFKFALYYAITRKDKDVCLCREELTSQMDDFSKRIMHHFS